MNKLQKLRKIFLFLFYFLFIINLQSESLTILEHYYRLPEKLFQYEKFQLKNEDNKWYGTSRSYGIGIKQTVIIDTKNGFLKIATPPNDGVLIGDIEIAIFRNDKKQYFIAINEKSGSNDGSEFSFHIYQFKDDKYIEANKRCLPELKPELFLSKKFISKKYLKRKYTNMFGDFTLFNLKYELPRYGTNLKVAVYTDGIKYFLDNDDKIDKLTKKIIREYLKSIEHKEIILHWDKQNSKFKVIFNSRR